MEAQATATPSPVPVAAEGFPRASLQQWDLFEVVLSKPSGRQKLGMVLKHAQVVGEKKVKRGAYLASLAEGPSVAQDLGLTPKDRLISVEGLDVKTLQFDRIVALIRKASFPLTLVWSRQRKDGVPENLPGTAVVAGAQRAVESCALEVPPAPTSSDIEPCPDAAAGGAGRKPASEAANGSTASVGPPLGSLGPQFRPATSSSSFGATWNTKEKKIQQHQQQSLTAGSRSSGVASNSTAGDGGAHKGGVFTDEGTCVVDSSFSDGNNAASSLNNNQNQNHNLAYVAEEWIRTTSRGRATARTTRETEVLGDGGAGLEARRASTGMTQVQQRNPHEHHNHQHHLERLEQQYRHQQSPGNSMRQPDHRSRQRQHWPHSMMPPTQRMPHWQKQSQQEQPLQRGDGGFGGSMSIGSGNNSSGSDLPLSEPAAGAVSGVVHLPPPPANPSWVQGSAAATTTAGGADGGNEGGVSESGVGCREKVEAEAEAQVLKEREAEAIAMREAMRARRRERDKARREKVRREMAAGGTVGTLHDRRQQAEGQGGAISGLIGAGGGGGGQQLLNRPHRGAFGKGKLGGGIGAGIGAGVVGARASETEEGGGIVTSATAAGAPEWLDPLVKAELRGFPGTRHCRSRLKKIFCHEWVQQEYHNGISTGQIDPTMPPMEFLRRRMGSGRLYALLLEDSKDYLRPGVYADTDVELVGTHFAHALIAQEVEKVHALQMPRVDADGAAGGSNKWKPDAGVSDPRAVTAAALGHDLPSGVMRTAGGNGGSSCSKGGSHGVSWAEHLRNFQMDVPTTTYDLTCSDETEDVGVGVDGAGARGTGETDRGVGVVGGKGSDVDVVEWDGRGVDASVVIQHRRRFDARCCAYEALNNASRNDKTSIVLERAQRLHQDHAAIITAKRATLEGTLENVRSQLLGREDQLQQLRMEQSHINPMDGASIAACAESEAAILSRITEKKLQMSMILEEASKVVDWERTVELAWREAMQRAADVHGHGGASAAEATREKNDLVQAMMSQKATIVLLTTLCKIPGPWVAPNGHVRRHPSAGGGGGAAAGVGIMGGNTSAAASSVREVPLGNPLGNSDEKSSAPLISTATIANNSSSSSSKSILRGSPNPNPSSATGGMQICSLGVGGSGSGSSSNDDRINNKNGDRKSCGSPGSGKRGNGYAGQQSEARHPLTPQGKPEPKPSEQQRQTANNSPPQQKIKSIKLRLRPPRSSPSSSSKADRPVTVTDPVALPSAPGSATEADVTAATATADEGGGRWGGDDGASTSVITRRRSHEMNIAAGMGAGGAAIARGGKEAAMARMAAEKRAVEEAAAAEVAVEEGEGKGKGGLDHDDYDGNDSGEESDRAMTSLGANDDGAQGRGGGTSGSGSESGAAEDGYDEYHGHDDDHEDHDEDNQAGEGGGSAIDGVAMEEGYQGEDGIGPLSFQLAGSSCGSDAGGEEEEEGSGAEMND